MKYEIIICPACGVDVVGYNVDGSCNAFCDCGEIITESDWRKSDTPIFTLQLKQPWFTETKMGRKPWEYRRDCDHWRRVMGRIMSSSDNLFKIMRGVLRINGKWYTANRCIIQYINGYNTDPERRWFVHCSGQYYGYGDPSIGGSDTVMQYCIGNGAPVSGQGGSGETLQI